MGVPVFGDEVLILHSKTGITDQSGNGFNSTYLNGADAIETPRNRGFCFDGINDAMVITDGAAAAIGGGSGCSFSCWVMPGLAACPIMDITISGGTSKLFADVQAGGNFRVGGRSVVGDTFQSAVTAANTVQGKYQMLTGVLNVASDSIQIYINGVLSVNTSVAFSGTTMSTAVGTLHRLGANAGGTLLLRGLVEELRLWGKVLTADNVSDLYNLTLNAFPSGSLGRTGIRGISRRLGT
jgi:hypothetical protein